MQYRLSVMSVKCALFVKCSVQTEVDSVSVDCTGGPVHSPVGGV